MKFVEFHKNGELVLINAAHIVQLFVDRDGKTTLSLTDGLCKIDESYNVARMQLTI